MKAIQILINAKDNASKVFDSLQAKVTAVFTAISAYLGIQAFVGLVKDAGEFEAAMDRVEAATGASAEEMRGLEAAVKDAASAGFTNTETAAALENIAKAGVDAQEAVGGLPGVMNLAKAGDIELAQSAEYLTKIVAAMGEQFGEAGRYADVLAMGANASNTSVTGLAQALSYAAPAAKAVGLNLESTVGLLGKFADNGIDASRAGTALNSILSQFLDPASKFRNELALAGITTNNFEEALKQLAEAGPRGEKAILAVGMEAGPALRGLLNTGIGALDDLIGKLKSAEGSAAATAKTLSGNLNGSLKSLSNVWQSVKDVLGAPVLPVLKQGVDELTAAFRRAIEDGTVQRFGESIATAMRQGIQFVREFLATVDFTVVIARMQAFADESNATLTRVGEFATNAGNVVKLAWGVMTAGIDGAMVIIYKTTEIMVAQFARIQLGAAALIEALSKITFGELSERYKRAADEIRLSAEATAAASQALGEKAKQALEDATKGAELAREGWAGVTAAISDAKDATDTWALAVANAAAEIERASKVQAEATVKAQAAKKASEDHAAALSVAKDALAKLREEYEAAVRDGNWQKAAELQEKLNQALRGMKGSAQDAAKAAQDIQDAFRQMGIVSSAALRDQATLSQGLYEKIKESGLATAEDLSKAFKKAAEDAIAANKGIAPAWVIAEAGVRGYKIAVDEAGRATLEAANKGTDGLGRLATGWRESAEAIRAHEDAMDRILMKHKLSADYTERQIALLEREAAAAEKAAEAYRKKWNMDKEGYSLNTAGERINQGETQEQIDEDVKRRYGEENVNNPDAQRARQLAVLLSMMSQLGGQVRDPATSKQIADMRRELQELEFKLLNNGGVDKPKDPAETGGASGGRGGSSSNDNEDDSRGRRPGRGGGVSAGSGAGGIAPVINIHLAPGVDLSNRAEAERMARQLIPAIETLSRRGFHA